MTRPNTALIVDAGNARSVMARTGRSRRASAPKRQLRYRRRAQLATQAARTAMEAVTRRIRVAALQAQGIDPNPEEQRLHNLVRAPSSIMRVEDLRGIEAWLMKIMDAQTDPGAKRVVASQWMRACIRAAPLGSHMWRLFRCSPLHALAGMRVASNVDLAVLACLRMDYASRPFHLLRRLGLSA